MDKVNLKAIKLATDLIKEFEGCRLISYPDPETKGDPWTIGWGSTSMPDGSPVKKGQIIDAVTAGILLDRRVQSDWIHLSKKIPIWYSLNSAQQAALVSFTYNCGKNWYLAEGFDTISGAIGLGLLKRVPSAMMLYVNPGGPSEAGLRRRRTAEAKLWNSGQH